MGVVFAREVRVRRRRGELGEVHGWGLGLVVGWWWHWWWDGRWWWYWKEV
jgi:hypothetical protein